MKNLVINGKYNLSLIMKIAHSFLRGGSRNIASALRKAWDLAQDQMYSFKQQSWIRGSEIAVTGNEMRGMGFKLD